jgi:hypothetical protein
MSIHSSGHHDIQQNQIGLIQPGHVNPFPSVFSLENLTVFPSKDNFEKSADLGLIINDENFFHRISPWDDNAVPAGRKFRPPEEIKLKKQCIEGEIEEKNTTSLTVAIFFATIENAMIF